MLQTELNFKYPILAYIKFWFVEPWDYRYSVGFVVCGLKKRKKRTIKYTTRNHKGKSLDSSQFFLLYSLFLYRLFKKKNGQQNDMINDLAIYAFRFW